GRAAGRGARAARQGHARAAGLRARRPPRARQRHGAAPPDRRAASPARRVRGGERRAHLPHRRKLLRQAEERVPLSLRRVAVEVGPERLEEARATMLELFPEGFEEVDRPEGVELAAYTDAAG